MDRDSHYLVRLLRRAQGMARVAHNRVDRRFSVNAKYYPNGKINSRRKVQLGDGEYRSKMRKLRLLFAVEKETVQGTPILQLTM